MYQWLLVSDTIIQFIVIIKTTSSSINIIKRSKPTLSKMSWGGCGLACCWLRRAGPVRRAGRSSGSSTCN